MVNGGRFAAMSAMAMAMEHCLQAIVSFKIWKNDPWIDLPAALKRAI